MPTINYAIYLFWVGTLTNALCCGFALYRATQTEQKKLTALLTLSIISVFSGGFMLCVWLSCTLLNPSQNYLPGCTIAWTIGGILPSLWNYIKCPPDETTHLE